MAEYPVHPGALEAYEDPDFAARFDAESASELHSYVRLARGAREVLEYGAGTGRVTLPMARAGAHVVAVDLSRTLLDALTRSLGSEPAIVRRRVTTKQGDMRSLRLGRTFPLVVAPSDTFSHLYSRQDVEGFLACVLAHLAPVGRLVFDLSMPHLPRAQDPIGPGDGASRADYDPMAQVLSRWWDSSGKSVLLARRLFFPRELELLLHHAGFGAVRVHAVPDGRFGQGERLRVSCRARRTMKTGA